jgi:hypothetical protein
MGLLYLYLCFYRSDTPLCCETWVSFPVQEVYCVRIVGCFDVSEYPAASDMTCLPIPEEKIHF